MFKWRAILLGTVALIAAAAWAASSAGQKAPQAGEWPNWRGPSHNGISTETDWSTSWPEGGPKVLWKASVGTGFSSVAVSGGRVYTMGNIQDTDYLWCFDAKTGRKVWDPVTYPSKLGAGEYEGGTHCTPAVDGDRVYIFSKWGLLQCVDAATGKGVWKVDLPEKYGVEAARWHFASSPLIVGNLVIVNAGAAGMAFDKAKGSLVWKSGSGTTGYSTPVPFTQGGVPAVAMFGADELLAVRTDNGKVLWRTPWVTKYAVNAADPIIQGDSFFISSGYNRGCSLVKATGDKAETVWENRSMRNHFNSCVLHNGFLYGFDEIELKCLEWNTGKEKWAHRGLGKGSLVLAGDKLIVLSDNGKLVVATASDKGFQPVAEAKVLGGKCWTSPVLAGGHIYCRNAAGDLVCVDVSK